MLSLKSPGLLNISVFPTDGVGHLAVRIEVTEDLDAVEFARIQLRTDYSGLFRFHNQLTLMAEGELNEIVLEERADCYQAPARSMPRRAMRRSSSIGVRPPLRS